MERKLLFFDIDDTLVEDETQKVPASAIEGIQRAHDRGHLIFINTGRCKSFIQRCLDEVAIDGYSYACGSHIEYGGKVLFEKFVPMADAAYIRDAMLAADIQGIFQGPKYCYFGKEERSECYPNFDNFLKIYDRDYHAEKRSFYEDEMEINKLVTFRIDSCDYRGFRDALKDKYQLIENKNGFTEILPLPYTKASCMDFLMDYFQIDSDDCYVFGDSPNDLPMLRHVKNSIAMGNSYDEVKESASYVTADIDKDGIFLALEHFNII